MTTSLEKTDVTAAIERVLIGGDLAALNPEERIKYYKSVCESLGLNPLTKPFDYLELNGKLVLYATKACTDQLRANRQVSINVTSREKVGDVYIVTARARDAQGREDESTGAVPLLKEDFKWEKSNTGKSFKKFLGTYSAMTPEEMANAMMKAETKAKRRVTLSISGLGFLDESEVETIPQAQKISHEKIAQLPLQAETTVEGEVIEKAPANGMLPPGERTIQFGKKYTGRRFKEFPVSQIQSYVEWLQNDASQKGKPLSEAAQQFLSDAKDYIGSEEIPF